MKDSKIFVPLVPSLFHLAVVKVAIELHNESPIETLVEAFETMGSEDEAKYSGAQRKLSLLPKRVRGEIKEAIHDLKCGVELWKEEHQYILELDGGERLFHWKCNGTLDAVKTAQLLVLNPNIEIEKRFILACRYSFQESVEALWAEMETAGKTEKLESSEYPPVNLWVKWLHDRSRVPSETWEIFSSGIRFHSFVPSLAPEERMWCLHTLVIAKAEDFLLCLYELTKEEEEVILGRIWFPEKFFQSCLQLPMRSFLLKTAAQMWKYIDGQTYRNILSYCLNRQINRDLFDFNEFFECLWKSSPDHLREEAKKSPELAEEIETCLEAMREKRKAYFDELRNYKRSKLGDK